MKRITRSRDWDEAKLCWGRLDTIENILGDDYDLERLKELVEADKEGKIMRQTWQCDYCGEVFLTKEEAAEHEKNCGRNPENKITDPTIFRLSMILNELPWVIATALYELRDDLPFLICEVKRAGTNNCPYMIYEYKYRMIDCLQKAQAIADSSNQSKAIKLRNAEKYFPGLLAAIIDTLKQPNLTSEKRKRWTKRDKAIGGNE